MSGRLGLWLWRRGLRLWRRGLGLGGRSRLGGGWRRRGPDALVRVRRSLLGGRQRVHLGHRLGCRLGLRAGIAGDGGTGVFDRGGRSRLVLLLLEPVAQPVHHPPARRAALLLLLARALLPRDVCHRGGDYGRSPGDSPGLAIRWSYATCTRSAMASAENHSARARPSTRPSPSR